ncbi:MAG: hypothetical protein ABI605_04765 [Rhizobacter sp.]
MNLNTKISLSSIRKAAIVLPTLALLALAVDPAMAADAGSGAMQTVFDQINGITPGVKAIVAVVGFIVALVSLVALRSFSAVLFFLGLAVFGAGGLAMAQTLLGATTSLI